ncbi:44850_t:CDS:2, partial [Gigaspora margarita]
NCKPLSTSINGNKIGEIDLTNMLTIFDEEEEDDIVDLDEESDLITTANGGKFKLSQPQNTDNLVEKDAPLDSSLIAMLLDSHCKLITKLDNWERNKTISLLQEKYNSLCVENENITDLPNEAPKENQMQLYSIMFGSDIALVKNEMDEYLKINQLGY